MRPRWVRRSLAGRPLVAGSPPAADGPAEVAGLAAGIATVRSGPASGGLVALTFDDGPDPALTEAKLRVLTDRGASATFFLLGKLVDRLPRAVRSILAAGSEVANHTYDHPRLAGRGYGEAASQIERTRLAIDRALGGGSLALARSAAGAGAGPSGGPALFRPPYGEYDDAVLRAAAAAGCGYNVLWDTDPSDYQRPSPWILPSRVVARVKPGSIVVLHDWVPETAEALPAILDGLSGRGLRAVTVSELLRPPAPAPPGPPEARPCRTLFLASPYLSGADVQAVQRALSAAGLDPGPADGVYGPRTARAVAALQTRQGLPVNGVVTAEVYRRLGLPCR